MKRGRRWLLLSALSLIVFARAGFTQSFNPLEFNIPDIPLPTFTIPKLPRPGDDTALSDQVTAMYIYSVNVSGRFTKEDREDLERRATKGEADAQLEYAIRFDKGRGVEQSREQAMKWFKKSAEGGNADAQTALGTLYLTGENIPQHFRLGKMWLSRAVFAGHALGNYNMGFCKLHGAFGFEQDLDVAERHLGACAGKFNGNAWYFLGLLHLKRSDRYRAYQAFSLSYAAGCRQAMGYRDAIALADDVKAIAQDRTLGGTMARGGVVVIGPSK